MDDKKPEHDWIHECNWALRTGMVPSQEVWQAVGRRMKNSAYKDTPVWGLLAKKENWGYKDSMRVPPRGQVYKPMREVVSYYHPVVANPQFFFKDDVIAAGLTYDEAMALKKMIESNY